MDVNSGDSRNNDVRQMLSALDDIYYMNLGNGSDLTGHIPVPYMNSWQLEYGLNEATSLQHTMTTNTVQLEINRLENSMEASFCHLRQQFEELQASLVEEASAQKDRYKLMQTTLEMVFKNQQLLSDMVKRTYEDCMSIKKALAGATNITAAGSDIDLTPGPHPESQSTSSSLADVNMSTFDRAKGTSSSMPIELYDSQPMRSLSQDILCEFGSSETPPKSKSKPKARRAKSTAKKTSTYIATHPPEDRVTLDRLDYNSPADMLLQQLN